MEPSLDRALRSGVEAHLPIAIMLLTVVALPNGANRHLFPFDEIEIQSEYDSTSLE